MEMINVEFYKFHRHIYNTHLIASCLTLLDYINYCNTTPGRVRSIVGDSTYDALQAFFALPVDHDKDFDLPEGV